VRLDGLLFILFSHSIGEEKKRQHRCGGNMVMEEHLHLDEKKANTKKDS